MIISVSKLELIEKIVFINEFQQSEKLLVQKIDLLFLTVDMQLILRYISGAWEEFHLSQVLHLWVYWWPP